MEITDCNIDDGDFGRHWTFLRRSIAAAVLRRRGVPITIRLVVVTCYVIATIITTRYRRSISAACDAPFRHPIHMHRPFVGSFHTNHSFSLLKANE